MKQLNKSSFIYIDPKPQMFTNLSIKILLHIEPKKKYRTI